MDYDTLSSNVCDRILKEVHRRDIATLKEVKTKRPDFHWSTIFYPKTGDTALHIAARLGFIPIIEYLLDDFHPIAVDVKNNDDKTPLHEAAQFSQTESVSRLCSYGANVNALKRGDWTPLMLACTKIKPDINLSIVQTLVEKGANCDIRNKDGWSCIHVLAREGAEGILDYLILKGVDVNSKTNNGRTPLHVASLHGHEGFVIKILPYIDVNSRDNCGNSPLHEAVLGQNLNLVKYLIEQEADINQTNYIDMSILHMAASQDNLEILNFIIQELKLNVNGQTKQGWTPAHCAAKKGLGKNIDILKKYGADFDITDRSGRKAEDYLRIS